MRNAVVLGIKLLNGQYEMMQQLITPILGARWLGSNGSRPDTEPNGAVEALDPPEARHN